MLLEISDLKGSSQLAGVFEERFVLNDREQLIDLLPAQIRFQTNNKGIGNYDIELACDGLFKKAFVGGITDRAGYEHREHPRGGGMSYYQERGYVPEGI